MGSGTREGFGSNTAAVLALAGSAIGLGNIWRFPYIMGQDGGALFIILYIIATVFISLPVFITELVIGRRSSSNAIQSYKTLKPGKYWHKIPGALCLYIPLLISSYYSVIGGWSIGYFFKACSLSFARMAPEASVGMFDGFIANAWEPLIYHLLFYGLCALIIVGGVKKGIEKFSKITIPILFVLIIIIAIYSLSLPGSREGVKYLFNPDFSKFSIKTAVDALGQSFYSLSLGMGTVITYGSYINKRDNLWTTSAGTAVSDLLFALLAGLAIIPAVFAAGIEPGAGAGLVFQSVPYIFSKMSVYSPLLSSAISILFFFAIIIAAMTSTISLIEVGTAFLVEKHQMKRKWAALIIFAIFGGLGVLCSLSFGPLSNVTIGGRIIFEFFDWSVSNILLFILAFINVVFLGFFIKKSDLADELTNGGQLKIKKAFLNSIIFIIKWVAPIAIAVLFVSNFIV